jgi:hypothetical protein
MSVRALLSTIGLSFLTGLTAVPLFWFVLVPISVVIAAWAWDLWA